MYVTINGLSPHPNSVATLPCEIKISKITAERLLIPSKLIGLLDTWQNLTSFRRRQQLQQITMAICLIIVQHMKHRTQVTQEEPWDDRFGDKLR